MAVSRRRSPLWPETWLLFALLRTRADGAPGLLDHTGGDLLRRLPDAGRVAQVDGELVLHDLGPHALTAGLELAGSGGNALVVVSAATPAGCALAGRCLDLVTGAHGPAALRQTLVVLDRSLGRYRLGRSMRELAETAGEPGLVVLPRDRALAVGQSLDVGALGRRARGAAAGLAEQIVRLG